MLDFSKIEAGRIDLERSPFDLREVVGDAMKSLAIRAHRKGLELACHIRPEVPAAVVRRLDPVAAGRSSNLVDNAIKFTECGEVVLEVGRESLAADELVLHVSVRDTGIGIPEDKRAKIFDAFEQADSTTTRRFGGTGLGLAICARLVELLDGRIWVDSRVGRGSTFYFTARFGMAALEGPAVPPSLEPARLLGLRVLVVDDNATNRQILMEMLANWEMPAAAVSGGATALDALREARRCGRPFRLVLSDVHMPDMDGFALAEQIELDPELAGTMIMMLTSGDRPGDISRCQQLTLAGYILKPVKQSELLDAITMAVGVATPDERELIAAAAPAADLGPLDILLAEDSAVNQKLVIGLLARRGHRVTIASNGKEALKTLETRGFDLVIMDIQMPEMDGLETTRTIRAKEQRTGQHVPIVAMTAHAMKEDRQRCLEAGMDGYISKPVRARHLFRNACRGASCRAAGGGDGARDRGDPRRLGQRRRRGRRACAARC